VAILVGPSSNKLAERGSVFMHYPAGTAAAIFLPLGGKVLRAELAHLFSRKRNEENRALGARASTLLMMGTGIAGLVGMLRRKFAK
jgi:hypothetical protein